MRKYWYTPQLMVPLLIEIEMRNLLYHIELTLLPDQIKARWQVRPSHRDPDLEGKEEIFRSYSEYSTWYENLKKTYGRRISRKQMVYAAYDETTRTFSYKPYENWATRRSKEKLNKPKEPILADELY